MCKIFARLLNERKFALIVDVLMVALSFDFESFVKNARRCG